MVFRKRLKKNVAELPAAVACGRRTWESFTADRRGVEGH
ncbi:hypothetical protein BF49_2908 [Bradyrhizobium sp.]|nr:hypothetical protein BF49_2908 [Bradyrhizobium sp.]